MLKEIFFENLMEKSTDAWLVTTGRMKGFEGLVRLFHFPEKIKIHESENSEAFINLLCYLGPTNIT